MDDNDSGCEDSGDAEAGGGSNDESNDHVDGGDGESIVDCGNDVDNDSSDKNNGDGVDDGGDDASWGEVRT